MRVNFRQYGASIKETRAILLYMQNFLKDAPATNMTSLAEEALIEFEEWEHVDEELFYELALQVKDVYERS